MILYNRYRLIFHRLNATQFMQDVKSKITKIMLQNLKQGICNGGMMYIASSLFQSIVHRTWKKASRSMFSLSLFITLFRSSIQLTYGPCLSAIFALWSLPIQKRTEWIVHSIVQALKVLFKNHFPITSPYSIVALLAMMSGPLLNCWMFAPDSISRRHLKTIDTNSAIPSTTLAYARKILQDGIPTTTCNTIHPKTTCTVFHTSLFPQLLRHSSQIYLPIHLALAVGQWHKTYSVPMRVWTGLRSFCKSTLFLTLFYQIPVFLLCSLPWSDRISVSTRLLLTGSTGALAALLEKPQRQETITVIVWTYTLMALGRRYAAHLPIPRRKHAPKIRTVLDITVFAAAVQLIFAHPQYQSPRLLQLLYGKENSPILEKSDKKGRKETIAEKNE